MIELSLASAFMLYLFLFLSVLFGLWLSEMLMSRKPPSKALKKVLITCEYCHFLYLEREEANVSKCPQCASFNRRQ